MALEYCQGKWFHDAVHKRNDPIARFVKSLWGSEGYITYDTKKQAAIAVIGPAQWNALSLCRSWVGDEAYYRAIYDAIQAFFVAPPR
jgi:hypothetical protein